MELRVENEAVILFRTYVRNNYRQIVTQQLFKKFENKCKNTHKVQIKLSKVQRCTTDLAYYSLTQLQTLKCVSGARAHDKNKQDYCCFLFFLFLFNYAIQGSPLPDSCIPR